ncbi:MAG: alpha-glucan family phosphorylase [Candidatus Nanopelagicales bacterium]
MKAIRRFTVRSVLPDSLVGLEELSLNLRWSWHPETTDLFAAMDPQLWHDCGGDPVRLLGEISADRLAELSSDASFVERVHGAVGDLHTYLSAPHWFQRRSEREHESDHERDATALTGVAYFSPEYGVAAALPQYSGGLGILAGDHLKAASDLGVPIIGIGLFYRSGYFRQSLSRDGWQLETYPICDPDAAPITVLREDSGAPARVSVGLPGGRVLSARIWLARVGRVPLLLLDSGVEENDAAEREVTDRLYGGGGEYRLQQEMLLGIGGVRALRAYCRIAQTEAPNVFHTNEGHAGFLGLERIRELMHDCPDVDFDAALEATRGGTVFTTHTPVPAGIDRFPMSLIEQYFGGDNAVPGLPVDRIVRLGSEDYPGGDPGVFNMAVMGLRLAGRANGVSALHGRVSRQMFAGLWPGFDTADIPITSITNGVHAPTWVAREVMELARDSIGEELIQQARGWEQIGSVDDERIWSTKRLLREQLVAMVRQRLRNSWLVRGAAAAELGWIDDVLDPEVLTIGFARRVPSYKRLTLMLRDQDRLRDLLLDEHRPVQLVIAGKAHPADDSGKALIQELVKFTDREDVRHRIVFLPDYDMGMAEVLYPGCDVWLNNPIRPLEASGTSGMKAALNGALNLSIMDGWWDEWFDGANGWSIPSADGIDDHDRRDDLEASAMYDLIAHSVAPTFYDRDHRGLPARWLDMVRHTLQSLGPKVLATRMVREYVTRLYEPAARSSATLATDRYASAVRLAAWKAHVRDAWKQVHVDHVESDGAADVVTAGSSVIVRAFVSLGELSPQDVEVQVVTGAVDSDDLLREASAQPMEAIECDDQNRWKFQAAVPLDRNGPFGYTVRVLPRHDDLISAVEMGLQALPAPGSGFTDGNLR